jgi:hypothetical protein
MCVCVCVCVCVYTYIPEFVHLLHFSFYLSPLLFLIIVMLGVHCDIYKRSYIIS